LAVRSADGSLAPIQETMLLAGLTCHAIPGLDFYTYAGQEAQSPNFGFSVPGAHTALPAPAPAPAAATPHWSGKSRPVSGTLSIRVPFGRLAGGLQYSFTQRWGFAGIGGTPERNEHIFFTSLRYYPF
jgi:hypothetical protein